MAHLKNSLARTDQNTPNGAFYELHIFNSALYKV